MALKEHQEESLKANEFKVTNASQKRKTTAGAILGDVLRVSALPPALVRKAHSLFADAPARLPLLHDRTLQLLEVRLPLKTVMLPGQNTHTCSSDLAGVGAAPSLPEARSARDPMLGELLVPN